MLFDQWSVIISNWKINEIYLFYGKMKDILVEISPLQMTDLTKV